MSNYIKNIPFIIFIISLIVYILTLSPTVSYIDSGELAAAVATLGICHPTGYPLFTMLGHIWTFLPISSSIIYELNLLSAVLIALASSFVYLISFYLLTKTNITEISNIIVSSSVALTFSFAETIWQQATSIEVYPLQILLYSAIIYFIIRAKYEDNFKLWLISALLTGLAFTNHMTTILIIPGCIYLFFKKMGKGFEFDSNKRKQFLYLLAFIMICSLIYLYLPIRSASLPVINWGWVHRDFDKFLYHVQGKQYQLWMFSGEQLDDNILRYFSILPYQFAFVGLIFIIIGIYKLYKISSTITIFIIINIISNVIYAINYSIHDIDSYFSLSFINLCIFIPFGFYLIFEKMNKQLIYSILLLPIINLVINYQANDMSNNYYVNDYTKAMSSQMEKNAIIITAQWDYFNAAMQYFQYVENYRNDIVIVEKELMRRTWYPLQFERMQPELYNKSSNEFQTYLNDLDKFEQNYDPSTYINIQQNFINVFRSIIEKNIDSRPIYIGVDILQTEPDIYNGYNLIPHGLVYQLKKTHTESNFTFDTKKLNRFVELAQKKRTYLDSGIVNVASISFYNTGQYYKSINKMDDAIKAMQLSYEINKDNFMIRDEIENLKKMVK